MIQSFARTHPTSKFISLRYFNPAGSHESGKLGDWPSNYPANLFPVLQEYILGKRKELKIFGSDYETSDGTGVRDYIHITDLGKYNSN